MDTTGEGSPGSGKDAQSLRQEILDLKKKWGEKLLILTHHYQRPEVVRLGDVRGDSFELAREASRREDVEHIVFCGVLFMAEAAAIVARPEQKVYHPNMNAGCPLADYADAVQVERAIAAIEEVRGKGSVTPVTYMNSDASVKAVCGAAGGTVCTSSNAPRAFEWALERGECVLFVPDEHLGWNTAAALSVPDGEVVVWDPWENGGNLDAAELGRARIILWRGHCHVHTWFRPDHIQRARDASPEALVYVHPECHRDVVALADGAGSTRYLVQAAEQAPAGATIYIGTEINLVTRLDMEHEDKTILPLARSLCPNMFRITLRRLRDTLACLPDGETVMVDQEVRENAQLALERMLALGGRTPTGA
ncbi:MAG: quinolinate synthase NadA [Deltaproteobacteria bacterium]|nr:quinolinate synthase NadA [Deltaproteobacteria bacterium]